MKKFNLSSLTSQYRANLVLSTFKRWLKKKDKILDVGSGTGVITNMLKNQLGIEITASDIKNYLLYDLPFIKIKKGNLPFPNHSFDAVLLIDVLHHIDKQEQIDLLAESLRVGNLVLIFEAQPTLFGKIADIILNKLHYGDLYAPLTFRDANEWTRLFKKLSTKWEFIKLDRPFWYPFSHIAFKVNKKKKR